MEKESNDQEGSLPVLPGSPDALKVLQNGELLKQNGIRTRRDLDRAGLGPDEIALLAGLVRNSSNKELNINPLDDILFSLQAVKWSSPLTKESFRALGKAIDNSMALALEAAANEKKGVNRVAYTLLYCQLYSLRYTYLTEEYKMELKEKTPGQQVFDTAGKWAILGLFKGFIDLIRDYFRSEEPEDSPKRSNVDFIIDFLTEIIGPLK